MLPKNNKRNLNAREATFESKNSRNKRRREKHMPFPLQLKESKKGSVIYTGKD